MGLEMYSCRARADGTRVEGGAGDVSGPSARRGKVADDSSRFGAAVIAVLRCFNSAVARYRNRHRPAS